MTDEKLVYEVRTSNRGMPIDDILKIAKDLVYKPEEVYVEPGNASMWFQFVFPAKYLYEEMDEQIEKDWRNTIRRYIGNTSEDGNIYDDGEHRRDDEP